MNLGLAERILLDNVVFLSTHIMKMAGISPLNHFKCINWCLILIVIRISSVFPRCCIYCKMQRRKWYSGQMPAAKTIVVERLVLWYEFDYAGKFSYVQLLIKEKYSYTIITKRYRFCCFKEKKVGCKSACIQPRPV